MKPVLISSGEWWFKGCFIQKQEHPKLKPYFVFKDTEDQESVDTCFTFAEAKKLCILNEVKKYKNGFKAFI